VESRWSEGFKQEKRGDLGGREAGDGGVDEEGAGVSDSSVGSQPPLSVVPLDLAATFWVEVMKRPGLHDAMKHERWGAAMERSEEGEKRRNGVVDSWRRR
jgi:hypothetical protein